MKRNRRSYREIFLDTLGKLSSQGESLVGNGTLRDALGWDEERYQSIKNQLRLERAILVGRGRGGTVGLADTPGSEGLNVFVSYSHVDEELKTELMKHLDPLRRQHGIETWHDRKLKAGDEWDKSISTALEKADLILLLVSIDFINSKYCFDIELEAAMERHAKNEARVVPIVLRNCLWQQTPFAKLQALPKDGKAVASWPNRDDALVNVAEGIRQVVEDLLSER